MMEYELFKEVVAERIIDYLPPIFKNYKPEINKVNKVNASKDALTVRDENAKNIPMPIVYLDEMYNEFAETEDLDSVLGNAATIIVTYAGMLDNVEEKTNLKNAGSKVIPNLISTEKNNAMLDDVPHVEILDMSVVYRIMIESIYGGYDSLLVSKDVLSEMEIPEDNLYDIAIKNMERMFPVELNKIERKEDLAERVEIPEALYYVSSKQRMYGAVYMLYEELLLQIANEMKCDEIFIIPFSIHEFGVVKGEKKYIEAAIDILYQNRGETGIEKKYLSRCIYAFSREKRALSKVASYKARQSEIFS